MRRGRLIAWIAVLAMILAACGGDAGGDTTSAETGDSTDTTTATETTEAEGTDTTTMEDGDEGDMEAPDAIHVGAVIPLTGAFAGGGAQVDRGYRYAVEAINAAGGVYVEEYGTSLPLDMTVLDDESDPNKTVSSLEELGGEGVVAYLGGFGSPVHAAGTAIAEKNAIPYLGVATALQALHEQGYQYYFSPFPKSPDMASSVFEMLDGIIAEGERPLNVGIFAESTDWGDELAALWEEQAAAHGYEIVLLERYAPGTTDFSDLILKAQAADVQALLSLPTPPDGFALYKQMGELGWKPPFSMVIRAADVPTWNDLGDVGDGVVLSTGWHPDLGYDGIDAINERHIEEEGRPADPVVGSAYACIQILADAIERAGTLDPQAIRDAIAATDLDTVIGPVTFREDGTVPIENPLMQRWEGGVNLIWPSDRATSEMNYPAN